MIVLLLAPNGTASATAIAGASAITRLRTVCWDDAPHDADADGDTIAIPRAHGIRASMSRRLWPAMRRNTVGRTIFRLSPLDDGALFWSAVSRDRRVAEAAREADILIAAERDGTFATWKLSRLPGRPAGAVAVAGVPAGNAAIARRAS